MATRASSNPALRRTPRFVEQSAPEEMFVAPRTDRVRQFLKRYNDRYRL
jgi:ABC-type histidine transport system ATPase subunit